jgi:TrmH family RNA methyltransferase
LTRVRIVLVRPESPANVGAVARVVRNTGLEALDLVQPGDWRTVECWRTAWGAQDVLEQARVFATLGEALSAAAWAAALTRRPPDGSPGLDVRAMALEVSGLSREDEVALVFGPETSGLTHAEMALCGRCVTIPTHPGQPSLNLSHAVAISAYEVMRAGFRDREGRRLASHAEKEELLRLLRAGLLAVEALPPENTEGYFEDWRALVQRIDLSPKELRLLEHMARKMAGRA